MCFCVVYNAKDEQLEDGDTFGQHQGLRGVNQVVEAESEDFSTVKPASVVHQRHLCTMSTGNSVPC